MFKLLLQKNKSVISVYLLCVVCLLVVLAISDKTTIHLTINRYHSRFADWFFKIATNLGDGIFVVAISLTIALFWKIKHGLYSLSVYLFSGIFVQIMKRLVWPSAVRPISFFEEGSLHLVEGIKMHHYHSFPSGHSASAFGLFFALIFIVNKSWQKWLFFMLSVVTGYSRLYLSQHFLEDVIIGSFIGVTSALFMLSLFNKTSVNWLQKPIIKI